MSDNDNTDPARDMTRPQQRELALLRLREGPPERLALSPLGLLEVTNARNFYIIAPSGRFLLRRSRPVLPFYQPKDPLQ